MYNSPSSLAFRLPSVSCSSFIAACPVSICNGSVLQSIPSPQLTVVSSHTRASTYSVTNQSTAYAIISSITCCHATISSICPSLLLTEITGCCSSPLSCQVTIPDRRFPYRQVLGLPSISERLADIPRRPTSVLSYRQASSALPSR